MPIRAMRVAFWRSNGLIFILENLSNNYSANALRTFGNSLIRFVHAAARIPG
jgi:hypothetical protein